MSDRDPRDDLLDDVPIRLLTYTLGDFTKHEGVSKTPERFVKAWKEWTCGYKENPADILTVFSEPAQNYNEMVFQGGISLWSMCEHHLAPFFGLAHIGYIPDGKIIGLSKFARLVDIFSRRLQVQERLTTQIAQSLDKYLQPKAVGVVLRCRHSCMESRGIRRAGSMTYTSALLGAFREDESARSEFLRFVERADAEIGHI